MRSPSIVKSPTNQMSRNTAFSSPQVKYNWRMELTMKTEIYCEIYTRKGVVEKRIVSVKRELPVEMTEAEAARWIFQSAGEQLPVVKEKHINHD